MIQIMDSTIEEVEYKHLQLTSIVKSVSHGILAIDIKGKILLINDIAKEMLKCDIETNLEGINFKFVVGDKKIYNSTVNDVLTRHCKACGISEISIHGLRHTHASLLLFAGVSIASVARRLGHASMTTTQKTYLHIIQELENKDVDLVMRTLSGL